MWRYKKTYFACTLLIALGVMLYVGFGASGRSMYEAKDAFYVGSALADCFASVTAASQGQVDAFRLEGVEEAMGRVVYECRVDMEGERIVRLRLLGYPKERGASGMAPSGALQGNAAGGRPGQSSPAGTEGAGTEGAGTAINTGDNDDGGNDAEAGQGIASDDGGGAARLAGLNRYSVKSGHDIVQDDEILVGQGFLDAHDIDVGDTLSLIVHNRLVKLRIAGTFMTPEYTYVIDEQGALLPDEGSFNVAVVSVGVLQSLLGMPGYYNELSFRFGDGVAYDDVKADLEVALQPFGNPRLTPIKDQLSNAMLESEINELVTMGNSIPLAFVVIAFFILFLMLKRIAEQERPQIGMMKAFGYGSVALVAHYGMYGAVTGLCGGLLGAGLGYWFCTFMLELYNYFFQMPNLVPVGVAEFALRGVAAAVAGGALGSMSGAWGVASLDPAPAMRPAAPRSPDRKMPRADREGERGRPSPGRGVAWISPPRRMAWLSPPRRMAWRSMVRNKLRSAFILVGMMFSYGLLVFMGSFASMMDDIILSQFTQMQVFDGRMGFGAPMDAKAAVTEVLRLSGVTGAEGLLELPLTLSHGHRSKDVLVTGLEADGRLYRLYDSDTHRVYEPPTDGIILSSRLAEDLEADVGDLVRVDVGERAGAYGLVVRGVMTISFGEGAYMERGYMAQVLGMGDAITGVVFTADDFAAVNKAAKEGANITGLRDQAYTRQLMDEMVGPYRSLGNVLLVMGIAVAFAIAYNTASISLMERKREYATLRVLGFTVGEVAGIMSYEYWLLGLCGAALGLPFARVLKVVFARVVVMEQFTLPTGIRPWQYALGFACICAAIAWSNQSTKAQVRKLDMVEVLKERE
ncbi:MAG: hypothetical protein LBR77_11150 [Lachnospiraceae bacterium]|nr:hypothetical protein [Lachnospiraceae bacterium]